MAEPIAEYVQDHMAGARFAIALLGELSEQKVDTNVAHLAATLLPDIESDRIQLEECAKQFAEGSSTLKEATAWLAQKASRFKLDLNNPLGIFEAVEMLTLGVLGKQALWRALQVVSAANSRFVALDLDDLIRRAQSQHQELETLRLQLAAKVFKPEGG
jgi:hypothetical protein